MAARLRSASRFYRFLWEIRAELFDESFQHRLAASYTPRGQAPCPPAQLAMALLLQRYDGLSDADAVEAAEHDRRWQLVLGSLGQASPFGQGSLVRLRTRMIAHDLDRELVERTVTLAKNSGKFGWKKLRVALDASPLHGCGRVEDSWNLIGRAMSKVVHAVSLALQVAEERVIAEAQLDVLAADSIKSGLDIDWGDEDTKRQAFAALLEQVSRLERWVCEHAPQQSQAAPLADAIALMQRVVCQDSEPDPPSGQRRLRPGVAEDRLISLSDTQMRHGRKSKTKCFNGYKRHIALVDHLIVATAVEPANVREHVPAAALLAKAAQHGDIEAVDIDRGYLASAAVEAMHQAGVAIYSRAWRNGRRGMYVKDDFHIDLAARTVRCPGDKVAAIMPSNQVTFDAGDCGACALKASCTSASKRSLTLHRAEDMLIGLRQAAKTKAGRQTLRRRVAVEHRLARLSAIQTNRARYRGCRKNELDVNRAAAIANLFELNRRKAA